MLKRQRWFAAQAMACALLRAQSAPTSPAALPPPEPTVVTVTARATPLSETSASVTVLSREYIESSHAETAADLLRAAPFLQLAQSGGSGGLTTITIRGSKPNFVMVLIDGIPVNDITTSLGGSFDFSSLPLDNIERIEIIRGPLSSIYGSDAIGGVINFISRRGGGPPTLDAAGEIGNFLWREARVSGTGSWKALQYSASGSFLDVGQQVEKDAYSVGSAAFNGSVSLGPNRILDFMVRYLDDEHAGFPTGSGGPELAILRQAQSDHSEERVLGTSFKGQVRPWWIYSLDVDRVFRKEKDNTPAIWDANPPTYQSLPSSTSNTDFGRTHVGATSRFIISPKLWAALGAGAREETGNAAGFLAGTLPSAYRISRTSLLANAEAQYSTGQFTATAGLSLQKTNGYGEVTSPRVGLSWRVNESGLRLKTSWAKGFKLPSFYSLADPNVGNPALRPERSRAFDGGFEQSFKNTGIISGTYFRNDYRDLVDFSSELFRLVNRSQALTQGIEFGAQYSATRGVHLGLDFSWTAWKLQDTSEPLRNIPHANGGIHVDWQISRRLRARAETQFMSRRYDYELPVPEETTVGGYSNTSLAADYALSERVTAYIRGDNVLNSKYHEYIGFPNPGISMRLGVVYHIQKPDKIH